MTAGWLADGMAPRAVRRLTVLSLVLAAAAVALCLLFVVRTSGGTVFLFSMASPPLVVLASAIVIAAMLLDYRRAHRLFVVERHGAGDVVFRQGDSGDCAFFVRAGRVEVVDEVSGRHLATLGPGDHFGEMALLDGSPRNATVRALGDVELAVLGKENFLHMLRLMPATEQAVMATVRERALAVRADAQPSPSGEARAGNESDVRSRS